MKNENIPIHHASPNRTSTDAPTPKSLTLTSGEYIFTERMAFVADMRPEYAALSHVIVRRYNAHEEMLAALKDALECIDEDGETTCYDAPDEMHSDDWNAAIAIRAAIAKAEGR